MNPSPSNEKQPASLADGIGQLYVENDELKYRDKSGSVLNMSAVPSPSNEKQPATDLKALVCELCGGFHDPAYSDCYTGEPILPALSSNAAGVQDTDTDLRKQEAISDHCARPTDGALEPFYCTHCRTQPHDLASNIRCIREEGRVSPSLLQRRFRYGYGHAMEVIEELVKRGLVVDEHNGKFHLSSHVTKSDSASGSPKSVSGSTVAAPAAVPDNAEVARLRAELENIANAKPSEWGDMRDQFQQWAQSRARHALSSHGGQPESADGSGDKLIFNVREFLFRVNAFPFDGEGIAWAGLKTKAGELAGLLREKFGGSGDKRGVI